MWGNGPRRLFSRPFSRSILFSSSQGKYDEAGLLYGRSLTIREKALGQDHPDAVQSLHNWAGLLESQV